MLGLVVRNPTAHHNPATIVLELREVTLSRVSAPGSSAHLCTRAGVNVALDQSGHIIISIIIVVSSYCCCCYNSSLGCG